MPPGFIQSKLLVAATVLVALSGGPTAPGAVMRWLRASLIARRQEGCEKVTSGGREKACTGALARRPALRSQSLQALKAVLGRLHLCQPGLGPAAASGTVDS